MAPKKSTANNKSINIKEKGYLNANVETQLKIVFSMIKKNKALSLSEIAKASKLPRQLVNYHLPLLISKGLVLANEDKSYMLQPYFYIQGELIECLKPLVNHIAENICIDDIDDIEKAITEGLTTLLAFWSIDIE